LVRYTHKRKKPVEKFSLLPNFGVLEEGELLMKPENFQKRYPRHFWALEKMEDGEFKQSLWASYEAGKLSQGMKNALWRKADELEFRQRSAKEAPLKDVLIEGLPAIVTQVREMDIVNKFSGDVNVVDRVRFQTIDGWRGWVDFPSGSDSEILRKIQNRSTDCVTIGGTIVWRKPEVAIISHTDFTAEEM
jgi:hypothetical protein